jgi:hypothetical protein
MSVEAIRLMNARLCVSSAKAKKEPGATFRPFAGTLAGTRCPGREPDWRAAASVRSVKRVLKEAGLSSLTPQVSPFADFHMLLPAGSFKLVFKMNKAFAFRTIEKQRRFFGR